MIVLLPDFHSVCHDNVMSMSLQFYFVEFY